MDGLLSALKFSLKRNTFTSDPFAVFKEQVWRVKLSLRAPQVFFLHMINNKVKTLHKTPLCPPRGEQNPSGCTQSISQAKNKSQAHPPWTVNKRNLKLQMGNAIYLHYHMPQTTLSPTPIYLLFPLLSLASLVLND